MVCPGWVEIEDILGWEERGSCHVTQTQVHWGVEIIVWCKTIPENVGLTCVLSRVAPQGGREFCTYFL